MSIKLVEIIGVIVGTLLVWYLGRLTEKLKRKSFVKKYREFIGYSAWALQERIDSILNKSFATYYEPNERYRDVYATNTLNYTVFLFCQFFAWREIINREMYNFRFRWWGYDSRVLKKLIDIEYWFSTDLEKIRPDSEKGEWKPEYEKYKRFMIFRGEQRVLGDLCIDSDNLDCLKCISFATFIEKEKQLKQMHDKSTSGDDNQKSNVSRIFPGYLSVNQLTDDVKKLLEEKNKGVFRTGDHKRLLIIHNYLLELLAILDPWENRYPENREYYDLNSNKGETVSVLREEFHAQIKEYKDSSKKQKKNFFSYMIMGIQNHF